MAIVLRFLPSAGALAVYDTPTPTAPDDGPMTAPLSNLSRIKFHSGLTYPAFIPSLRTTSSSTLPNLNPNTRYNGSINLFAHGRGEVPILFGRINSVSRSSGVAVTTSTNIPWHGSVPVATTSGTIWVTLGADATHVVMRYFGWRSPGTSTEINGLTVNWTVDVLDATISGTNQFAGVSSAPQLELLGTRITAGRRKFDTDRTYMRQNAGTNQVRLARGATMTITGDRPAYYQGSFNVNIGYLGFTYDPTTGDLVGY